jgi:general secretion pathway protein G
VKVMSIIGIVWFSLCLIMCASLGYWGSREAAGWGVIGLLYAIPYSITMLIRSDKNKKNTSITEDESRGSILRDSSNQNTSLFGIVKTSAAAKWSLICGYVGFSFALLFLSSAISELLPDSMVYLLFGFALVGFALGTISLILGMIILVRTKRLSGKLKGSGIAIAGLILGAATVALLAPVIIPHPSGCNMGLGKHRIANIQISELEKAIQEFQKDTSRLPTAIEGLDSLVHNPGNLRGWKGPYVKKSIPLDPWSSAYIYRYPGDHGSFNLYSCGADGIAGTEDDIADWAIGCKN